MKLPELTSFHESNFSDKKCAYIFAMGFEERAIAIPNLISEIDSVDTVVAIRYVKAKGTNREKEALALFATQERNVTILPYSSNSAHEFEYKVDSLVRKLFADIDEIVLDVSAMSKMLIMVLIVVLLREKKKVHVVFSEAEIYAPTKNEFDKVLKTAGNVITTFAGKPTLGIATILRSTCLSSSRMQGQPVCAVAFTSFNEELIRHSIGTLNPHRLILINGVPSSKSAEWRAHATQRIHSKLVEEFSEDNSINPETGLLGRSVSTLDYSQTIHKLLEIRRKYGTYERIVYFATGSKMQTVALAVLKASFDDVHIEYPIPDSYFFKEYSRGVGNKWQLLLDASVINAVWLMQQDLDAKEPE